jgi:hypothetical protein
MNKIEKQILTNQLCILATLGTIGEKILHPIQQENIQKRIKETMKIRDERNK